MPPVVLATHKGVEFHKLDEPHVELCYPRVEPNAQAITIGLMDVRAADNIRVSYDFYRDGWKIEQMSMKTETGSLQDAEDTGWMEMAFIQAWGLVQGRR